MRLLRKRSLLLATVVIFLVASQTAWAHSFLIRSDPAAGARLLTAPKVMTLNFSEPFVTDSEKITLRHYAGSTLVLAKPQGHGAVIRQTLPHNLHGVFVVSWRVLSEDGHVSLGEFAFAVGRGGAVPTVSSTSARPWSQIAASWLVFLGVALALGGVVSERVVWRTADVARAPVGIGIALAAIGAAAQLVLLAGGRRGRGFGAGFSAKAIGDVVGARPGTLTVALLIALFAAGLLLAVRRLHLFLVGPLVVAIGLNSARGHSGTAGRVWALPADVVHLTAVALWVGALTHLVIIVIRSEQPGTALLTGARRYSRFALPTVLVILATGAATAIPEFRNLSAVTGTSYGRTLLIKAALIGLALLTAIGSRWRALPAKSRAHISLLRRLTGTEAVLLVVVLAVAAVLVNSAPPRSRAAAPLSVLGPPPLREPVLRLAEFTGQLVVALAANPTELEFTIVPPSNQPQESVKLSADAVEPGGRAVDLFPRTCGRECFTIRYRMRPGTTTINAHVSSSVWSGGDARFTISAPIPAAKPQILGRVVATLKRTRTLHLTESVSSGPSSSARPAGYDIGGRAFLATDAFASGAVDVRAIGHRNGLTELAFALPGSNIWYRFWIDSRYRLRGELIVDAGHFIRRTFSYGGRPVRSGGAAPFSVGEQPPPAGAVVFGREDGDLAIGLSVSRRAGNLEIQTTVLGPDGKGASTFRVGVLLRTSAGVVQSAWAMLCGRGCYRVALPGSGRSQTVEVDLSGGGRPPSSVRFRLPARWPAPDASALLRHATAVWRRLRSLVIVERLGSNLHNVLHTRYEEQAPDELSYQIAELGDYVVIGTRRWDRPHGKAWQERPQMRLAMPTLQWGPNVTNAHLLGSAVLDRRPVWLISFYDPGSGGFFQIWVDKKTLHTLKLTLIAASHFMRHLYSDFNAPLLIRPPR